MEIFRLGLFHYSWILIIEFSKYMWNSSSYPKMKQNRVYKEIIENQNPFPNRMCSFLAAFPIGECCDNDYYMYS